MNQPDDHLTDPLADLLRRYPDLAPCLGEIRAVFERLVSTFAGGGKLLICGNGGSAADSEHIVGELMKGFALERPIAPELRQALERHFPADAAYLAANLQGALPAISLVSQSALLSAFANDVAPEMAFAQQVYGYARPGDALLAISTSGNARNVVNALKVARALGVATLGLTGRTGGQMAALCDAAIRVPYDATLAVQERHLPIYHALCLMLERHFF